MYDAVSEIDTEGLICAFQLAPWGALGERTSELKSNPDAPIWIHFNLLDNRARRYLSGAAALDEEGREVLLDSDTRSKCATFAGGFAVSLVDLHYDFNADPENFGTLRVYVDGRRVISCRQHRVRSIDRVRRRLQAGHQVAEPSEVFDEIVEQILDGFASLIGELSEAVEEAEDRILAGRHTDQAAEIGRIRRLLARLRRHLGANRGALAPLLRPRAGADSEQRERLRQALERLDQLSQDMELIAERGRLLQEEIASALHEGTSRNLYVLSIMTTALLPITLITGIFGMNVGGLPFLASPHGFWWVIFGMSIAVVVIMGVLRRTGVFR
jgi:zinc transporter